jgi:hypothetical protein
VWRSAGVPVGQRPGGGQPAGAGPEQPAEQQRQGGLAGAVAAQHGEHLAGPYRQLGRGEPGRQPEPVGGEQHRTGGGRGLARRRGGAGHPDSGGGQLGAVFGEDDLGRPVGAYAATRLQHDDPVD